MFKIYYSRLYIILFRNSNAFIFYYASNVIITALILCYYVQLATCCTITRLHLLRNNHATNIKVHCKSSFFISTLLFMENEIDLVRVIIKC